MFRDAGRTGTLTSTPAAPGADDVSGSVRRLCPFHAEYWPIRYWRNFAQKLIRAGVTPSRQLVEKLAAWRQLSVYKNVYRLSSGRRSRQAGTQSVRQHPSLASSAGPSCSSSLVSTPRCCCPSCTGAGCDQQLCWQSARGRQQPATTHNDAGATCLNGDCALYSESAEQLCSVCLMLLSLDDGDQQAGGLDATGRHQQTAEPQSLPPTAAGQPARPFPAVDRDVKPGSGGSSSDGSRSTQLTACIAPVCSNEGLDAYNGLCAACHSVLVKANSQQHQKPASCGTPSFVLPEYL